MTTASLAQATWAQDSPLGPLVITVSRSGVRAVRLHGRPRGTEAAGERVEEVARALDAYFAGDLAALDAVPVDLGGRTPFSVSVLTALRAVGPGALISYGRLAAETGRPLAARAVGRAVGANPVPIVVPCHRVVGGDGSLGGYSGGLSVKRWLLAHEGHAGDPAGEELRATFEPVPC